MFYSPRIGSSNATHWLAVAVISLCGRWLNFRNGRGRAQCDLLLKRKGTSPPVRRSNLQRLPGGSRRSATMKKLLGVKSRWHWARAAPLQESDYFGFKVGGTGRWLAIAAVCCAGSQGAPLRPLAAQEQSLHTDSGVYLKALPLKIASSDVWEFQLGDQRTPLAGSQIIRWGSWPGITAAQGVWLADGSWLCGQVQLAGETLSVGSDWLQPTPLAWRDLRGLVLTPPSTLPAWLELQAQMLAADGDQDRLWLRGGKKLSGIISEPLASGDQPPELLEVSAGGQVLQLPLEEIEAIVFSPALLGPLPAHPGHLQLGLEDGSLLKVSQLRPADSGVGVLLASGLELQSWDNPRAFCQAVRYLAHQPAAAADRRYTMLSDLPVASYRHISDSSLVWELGVDRDVNGLSLHTAKGIFGRGLAVHSAAQVAFRWDGSPARLLAEVTLAAAAPQALPTLGSARCQVLLARGEKLETVQQFTLSRRPGPSSAIGDTPAATHVINVDVSRAKLVVLVADKADFGQFGDHVLWLDARLAPAR